MATKTTYNIKNMRCKFSCKEVIQHDTYRIVLEAVYSGSPENREFFKYTPSGHITMDVVTSAAARQFKVGHDYYVDFTDAEGE